MLAVKELQVARISKAARFSRTGSDATNGRRISRTRDCRTIQLLIGWRTVGGQHLSETVERFEAIVPLKFANGEIVHIMGRGELDGAYDGCEGVIAGITGGASVRNDDGAEGG